MKKIFKFRLSQQTILNLCRLVPLIVLHQILDAQTLPVEHWQVRNESWMRDLGAGWNQHTLLNPYQPLPELQPPDSRSSDLWINQDLIRYRQKQKRAFSDEPQLKGMTWAGYLGNAWFGDPDSAMKDMNGMNWLQRFQYGRVWAQFYIRASTRESGWPGYTPWSRDIARAGMHAGEFDQALIGYRDTRFEIQFGRGRQIWGSDLVNNVMLSGNSASYEHLMGSFHYKKWTASFFTGFLETRTYQEKLFQRYIAGHAVQFSNKKNIVAMIGEVSVYSGENRPFDLSYLNPVSLHVETELNRRENIPYDEGNQSNAVYFFNVDWMTPLKVRVSGSCLFDEFQLDQEDRDQGRPDALAGRLKMSRAFYTGRLAALIYGEYESAGTYTFKHANDYTGFISRELPLGLPQGSDYYKTRAGVSCFLPHGIMLDVSYASLEQGDEDIRQNLYQHFDEYIRVPFPSGEIRSVSQLDILLIYSFRPGIDMNLFYQRSKSQYAGETCHRNIFGISVRISFLKYYSL
ncbi:hypothetical protein JW835_07280 [bacterium]|nr:hypothetical protein [bacterium]